MKIHCHRRLIRRRGVKQRRGRGGLPSRGPFRAGVPQSALAFFLCFAVPSGNAGDTATADLGKSTEAKVDVENRSDPKALLVVRQLLDRLANGPAFEAKVRERVWATGREVIGVGTYEQAGGGSGQFNLQVAMHDGEGKHTLQQISDGRLAWTRAVIAGRVSLRRVDVGRLDEWVRDASTQANVPPRLRIGAWTELLDSLERDYSLSLGASLLKSQPVMVITGNLRSEARERILAESGRKDWPELCPAKVHIAVATQPDPGTQFGEGLPVRFEFWSDPQPSSQRSPASEATDSQRRLITLIELYSIHPIEPPPIQRFRFENQDAEVNFINETDRYLNRYGIRLTEGQRRQLRR